ncbi:hypothetical protein ABZ816_37375 [Actinosynnema sp. NPDC047251]|uniref:Putative secreted protein n=1 Tax=Saccharothrix espanaensis (strain ATCC 51144 / DSM 44229 / JCM 9112 / NBRC 15066 / NRRL 15764) TaxID=1179773 RepID=K0K540_SACES|nr:hypothetical protein [Saccharothrix espanaensis]CCH32702.1 putative secreted protein [Saccharothrix espanaensis DSM 44229]
MKALVTTAALLAALVAPAVVAAPVATAAPTGFGVAGSPGPNCDAGLCAEFRRSTASGSPRTWGYGSFTGSGSRSVELKVTLYTYWKPQYVAIATATTTGNGFREVSTRETTTDSLIMLTCARITYQDNQETRQICDN